MAMHSFADDILRMSGFETRVLLYQASERVTNLAAHPPLVEDFEAS